ncbi:MAG: hypothetical protein FJ284_11520 [Planctomycetes bacterium]|nr:hypothetical protein [Planctomycetota bacterium]
MVETTGQCKEGMNIDYKSQWGRHPLVFSLANTGEPLYVVNRPGSRPSHEQAAATFDKAIALCLRAGFKRVRLRGDQDFSQTGHLDGWHAAGVKCIFGLRAAQNLDEHVENLPRNAWRELVRPAKHRVKTEPRRRPTNVKQQVVEDRCFKDIRLVEEYVAAFRHRPLKCGREYRIVVLWKDLAVHEGSESYSTTVTASSSPPTTFGSRPWRSCWRRITAAIRRISSPISRVTCTPSRLRWTRS